LWRWPEIYKALKKDGRIKRREGRAVIGGVKQTVERIEGEVEEEKLQLCGAISDTVVRTLRRFL
jgi:DNA-binding XRE family transcriptional regulator